MYMNEGNLVLLFYGSRYGRKKRNGNSDGQLLYVSSILWQELSNDTTLDGFRSLCLGCTPVSVKLILKMLKLLRVKSHLLRCMSSAINH